ncbi:amidohydrolase family protein [Sediminibacterium salmoneum]|uniref:amidohydrolase family protein n=1 Tax=Sediminibacterium salmoneum TaxID=426421 RepID=UPI000478DE21|nr:amidohydrolase family protein [Sediminibacterium salmoneum]
MKKIVLTLNMFLLLAGVSNAQETIYPAKSQKGTVYIKNGTVHVGNGTVIENATVKITNGKIEEVGTNISVPASGAEVIDATGKKVYPGLILPASNLGLTEITGVRATNDFNEIGEMNPSIRSIAAYNADSKITNTLRSNGILLAHTAPVGALLAGQSSVVQLDAWHWEDAAYKMDNGMHLYMPSLMGRPGGRLGALFAQFMPQAPTDPTKMALERLEIVKKYFREAKVYLAGSPKEVNLKLEAARGLFEKKQKLFVHASQVKQMLLAIDFAKEFDFNVVIVGGSESWQIAPLLKQHNIGVIISQMHDLPTLDDDDIDMPFKAPAVLQKAGVLFCINDDDPQNRGRNLPFNAGTAATYGLTKEEALSAITLNAAKILGTDATTGSIEKGKDANIVISAGDILDMHTSVVEHAFIQGRKIVLDNKHKQLYERYKYKYGIK